MNDHPLTKRHLPLPRLVAVVALAGLLVPLARAMPSPQDKGEAARVAKKVERAKNRAAHEAKEELEAIRDFQKRLERYVRVHENQLARLGRQNAVTAQALAGAIIRDREKAKQGDVFIDDVQPVLKKLIAEQLRGPGAGAAQKALREGDPEEDVAESAPVVPRVNAVYPMGATRSTVPPSVLLILPPLPKCLHYRFVGRDLLLVDSVAQVIVDVLNDAVPASADQVRE